VVWVTTTGASAFPVVNTACIVGWVALMQVLCASDLSGATRKRADRAD
jgi:hypothetical protein